jgi:hypothetical protein
LSDFLTGRELRASWKVNLSEVDFDQWNGDNL